LEIFVNESLNDGIEAERTDECFVVWTADGRRDGRTDTRTDWVGYGWRDTCI